MGLANRLLSKQLDKQMAKQEEAMQEAPLTPLGQRLLKELKEFVGDVGGLSPYISLFSGVVASSSDHDIRTALLAIYSRIEHILNDDSEEMSNK